ncbi:DUF3931 domain-containing protein [Bacillus sp. 165]|uniref:DUF3931 domain-containing protein n=1 Tax=Bacillus sp. 165 TaxID=1529117 RepID=UPI001ADA7564|nr:DUF3931 domain-containing protein [Bacillus sp. 165]MBO9128190.1 DUF3931 domain-containing protein [Bacillus sp. 165]
MTKKDAKQTGNIIALEGGKLKNPAASKYPALTVEGKTYELTSFVLCGETPEGKRLVLSHMVSTDDFAGLVKTLDMVLQKRIEKIFF